MKKNAQKDLLELLAFSLGNKECAELSSHPDWAEILRLAEEQAVLGILASSNLPLNREAYECFQEQLFKDSLEIISQNKHINEMQGKVLAFLEHKGINAYIKKGQAVAQYYPNPLLRMSGDIDVVVREEDYERAKAALLSIADSNAEELTLDCHIALTIGDVTVELHATEFCILSPTIREEMRTLTREMFDKDDFRIVNIDGYDTRVANPTYDAVYLFLHLLKHYHYEGVGLRQFIDWGKCLEYENGNQNCLIRERIRKLGLMKEWNLMGAFLVQRLGLKLDAFPEFMEKQKGLDIVERVVFYSGNMGYRKWQLHKMPYLQRVPLLVKDNYYMALGYWPFSIPEFFKQLWKRNWHDFSKSVKARI